MIVLQSQKIPLSTDFFIDKMTPFFLPKTLTFENMKGTLFFIMLTFQDIKGTLFLHNTDFCRLEICLEDP